MVSSGASHPRHFYADTLRLQPPVAQAKFGTKWFFQGFQGSHPLGRAGMWTLPRVGISPRSPIVQDPSDCVSEGVPTADAAPPPTLVLAGLPALCLTALPAQVAKSLNHALSASENSAERPSLTVRVMGRECLCGPWVLGVPALCQSVG